jgi:hypothetical protein
VTSAPEADDLPACLDWLGKPLGLRTVPLVLSAVCLPDCEGATGGREEELMDEELLVRAPLVEAALR